MTVCGGSGTSKRVPPPTGASRRASDVSDAGSDGDAPDRGEGGRRERRGKESVPAGQNEKRRAHSRSHVTITVRRGDEPSSQRSIHLTLCVFDEVSGVEQIHLAQLRGRGTRSRR